MASSCLIKGLETWPSLKNMDAKQRIPNEKMGPKSNGSKAHVGLCSSTMHWWHFTALQHIQYTSPRPEKDLHLQHLQRHLHKKSKRNSCKLDSKKQIMLHVYHLQRPNSSDTSLFFQVKKIKNGEYHSITSNTWDQFKGHFSLWTRWTRFPASIRWKIDCQPWAPGRLPADAGAETGITSPPSGPSGDSVDMMGLPSGND